MLTKEYVTELKNRGNGDIADLINTQHDVGTIVFVLESLVQLPANFRADFLYKLLSHNHSQVRLNAVKNIAKLNGKGDQAYLEFLDKVFQETHRILQKRDDF